MRHIGGFSKKNHRHKNQNSGRQGTEDPEKPAAHLRNNLKAGVRPNLIQLPGVDKRPQEIRPSSQSKFFSPGVFSLVDSIK